jgi:hypothetical protein
MNVMRSTIAREAAMGENAVRRRKCGRSPIPCPRPSYRGKAPKSTGRSFATRWRTLLEG